VLVISKCKKAYKEVRGLETNMKASGLVKFVIGLLLILVAVYGLFVWPKLWGDFLVLLKGGVPVVVFLVGLVFLLLGFED
jgi:uncharacterized membrane protein